MYECLYDRLKTACGAVSSYVYTTYRLTTWNRVDAANNCSIGKFCLLQNVVRIGHKERFSITLSNYFFYYNMPLPAPYL